MPALERNPMKGAEDIAKTPEDGEDGAPPKGTSPYASGGGGVTFERKVAVSYLAHLLVGDGVAELGDGRCVVSVAFQQAPKHPVDDLVVTAGRAEEIEPPLVLAIAVRRKPNIVRSDEPTQKLVRAFMQGVIKARTNGPEHRFALVVAGPQDHAKQLGQLADIASVQMSASAFFDLIRTPNKFQVSVRGRLDQLEALVADAVADVEAIEADTTLVQQRTWELLSRLTVLMPRLEPPDETDWVTLVNSLIPVARGGDLDGASRLRDRLVALADEYSPRAATVDLTVLRRGAHSTLDTSVRRNQKGWQALEHLNARAMSSIRDDIVANDGARRLHIDRGEIASQAIESATIGTAVVIYGESGVGKSAIVLAARPDADVTHVSRVNLRHLPRTTLEFESLLGCSLRTLLAELSAPQRMLVVDGADALAEGMLEQLRYLVAEARSANVSVVAITAADNKQVVRDTLAEHFGKDVVEHLVPPLTDPQVEGVVATFGELAHLAENSRSRELLRRPVIVDLFVRGGISGMPLSDADAMQQVWRGLVRRHEQSDRGTPDARDVAMLRLADLALAGGEPLHVVGAIDPTALDGFVATACSALRSTTRSRSDPNFPTMKFGAMP